MRYYVLATNDPGALTVMKRDERVEVEEVGAGDFAQAVVLLAAHHDRLCAEMAETALLAVIDPDHEID